MRWLVYAGSTMAVAAALQSVAAAPAIPEFSNLTSTRIQTLTMDSEVVTENRDELKKIPGDFAQAYRFHKVSIAYKQPGKLQFDATVAGTHITYTINGNKRFTSVPSFHVHKVEDISGAPGKKQSLLDCGLVPPELLNDFDGIFTRIDAGQLVYQVKPKIKSERFHEQVWVDPKTHIVTKRERYNQDGKLMSWYRYLNPTEPRPRMYVPTRVEVYNTQNKLAGVTIYTNIKINLGVDDKIFDF